MFKKLVLITSLMISFQGVQAVEEDQLVGLTPATEISSDTDGVDSIDADTESSIDQELGEDLEQDAQQSFETFRHNPIYPRPIPPVYTHFVCFARNGRGQVFEARGQRPRLVQQRALNHCYQVSRNCASLGCRRVR